MLVTAEIAAVRRALAERRREGATVGFVPTMGALHDGHVSLVRAAVGACDVAVASIFVNPLQFAADEDLGTYPRTLAADLELLEAAGVQLVFTPSAEAFTPANATTTVHVRELGATMEGASRPTHFDGVTTIVCKLLNVVQPERAYFGEKDFQQLAVVRRMVRDLDLPVQIVGCPIVREPDGLAMSSRNGYLSSQERRDALALSAALREAAGQWDGDADSARRRMRHTLSEAPNVRLDYAEVVDPETLEPLEGVVADAAQALVAAWIGGTRLIDNCRLEPPRGA